MTDSPRHDKIEKQFRRLVFEAGLPEPDDTAHLSRALIFLWYESKAFVLIDLDELPAGIDPLDGLDLEGLRADIFAGAYPPGFAEAA
jgi:hypothetical protein